MYRSSARVTSNRQLFYSTTLFFFLSSKKNPTRCFFPTSSCHGGSFRVREEDPRQVLYVSTVCCSPNHVAKDEAIERAEENQIEMRIFPLIRGNCSKDRLPILTRPSRRGNILTKSFDTTTRTQLVDWEMCDPLSHISLSLSLFSTVLST